MFWGQVLSWMEVKKEGIGGRREWMGGWEGMVK